jgi:hypothetical protein
MRYKFENVYHKLAIILFPIAILHVTATWFLVRNLLWAFPWLIYSYDFVGGTWLLALLILMIKAARMNVKP